MGICVRTTNEGGAALKAIPALWTTFFTQDIKTKIPNRHPQDSSLYCIYTDYEKDHTKPYTCFLGYRIQSDSHLIKNSERESEQLGEGFFIKRIPGGIFQEYTVCGELSKGGVYQEWVKIWQDASLKRTFTADYEQYDEAVLASGEGSVRIYLAIAN